MKRFLGIEIGGTKLQIVCGDEEGNIEKRLRFTVNQQEGSAGIRRHIEHTFREWKALTPRGIVVGFGGPVNRSTNSIGISYHIEGWAGFELASWIEEISGVPALLENDANTAALGEAIHGAGKNDRVVFYVTLGSGTGGGLVIDKELYHGAIMGESEFGHLRLDKTGRILESSCSGWAVNKKIRSSAVTNPQGKLAELLSSHNDAESKVLLEALQANDADAWSIFNETIDDLVLGLSHVVHLFHPDVIVLGGGLSFIGNILRDEVQKKLATMIMDIFLPGPLVKLTELKEDAVPIGCLAIAAKFF